MDVDQTYTIVRIKRKRNEEPLDALVIEASARRKKLRNGTSSVQDIFEFAQTVEEAAWDDKSQRQVLKDHISRLTRNGGSKSPTLPSASAISKPVSPPTEERRYTIVQQPEPQPKHVKYPTSPPKVLSQKEVAEKKDFSMYDAVLEKPASSPIDPELENFIPLLNDYLRLQDIPPPTIPDSLSEDYVYDVFYRRVGQNPAEYSGNIAKLSGLPTQNGDDSDDSEDEVEDEADEDSNDEDYYKNDYPDEEDDDSDELHYNSDSSDEWGVQEDSDHEWR